MTKILDVTNDYNNGYRQIKMPDPMNWNALLGDLAYNNTAFPAIKNIIYNVGEKAYPVIENGKRVKDKDGKVVTKTRKVLTTVVFFIDNTKVTVTTSEGDGAKFVPAKRDVTKIDENGKSYVESEDLGIETADEASKEMGLVYALAKRLVGKPDANGTIEGNGFGRKLKDLVSDAYDTAVEEKIRKIEKAARKSEYEHKLNTAEPKKKFSLKETLARFNSIMDKYEASH